MRNHYNRIILAMLLALSIIGCAGMGINQEQFWLDQIKANAAFGIQRGLTAWYEEDPQKVDIIMGYVGVATAKLREVLEYEELSLGPILTILNDLKFKLESEIAGLPLGQAIGLQIALNIVSSAVGSVVPTDVSIQVETDKFKKYVTYVLDGLQQGTDSFLRTRPILQQLKQYHG